MGTSPRYFDTLSELEHSPAPEDLAASYREVLDELNENSSELWESWLRLQPSRLSASQRQRLGRYVALLRMILAGNQQHTSVDKKVFHEYYRIFPEVAS